MADFFSAEQALQFSFGRCITFLYFCTTYGGGLCIMCLGRSGCSTDTVTSGTSAQKDNLISRIRGQSLYGTSRCGTHDSTDLHTFCYIIRMVNFFDISGCQSDLVSVRAVTSGCLAHDLLLWQLTLNRIFYGYGRICGSGHTHCLIHISSSGKRITDGST